MHKLLHHLNIHSLPNLQHQHYTTLSADQLHTPPYSGYTPKPLCQSIDGEPSNHATTSSLILSLRFAVLSAINKEVRTSGGEII